MDAYGAVAYVHAEGDRVHSRGWADDLAHEFDLNVSFFPFDWSASDLVQINAGGGGIRIGVESAALKEDPRAAMAMHIEPGDVAATGDPIAVFSLDGLNISLGVLVVCGSDTVKSRTRWRVRPEMADSLNEFTFLATGRRSGTVALRR